ncbi:MAG: helix-turn-helix domain-containing protein [Candidatus Altiarchaeales archaeon]|nr:helix-turn-helix domain-containing protein [Candidatus Altiarchaeales archaeon]
MKPQLLSKVVELLDGSGFSVSECMGSRSCFDLVARRGREIFLIKILSNIEGLNGNTVHELRKVASLVGGVPLVVGERLKSSRLLDGVLYERYGVQVFNVSTLRDVVCNVMPAVRSIRGNYCSRINSDLLRRLRERLDLTQEELARELGVSKQSVYRYESTGRVLSRIMEKMMNLFEENERLLLHESVLHSVPLEDRSYRMHVTDMTKGVADKLSGMGFSTSITNAPFDVVARKDDTVYALVSDDYRRLEQKIALVDELMDLINGYGMCVTNRSIGSKGVAVLSPEELDEFSSARELFRRISGRR